MCEDEPFGKRGVHIAHQYSPTCRGADHAGQDRPVATGLGRDERVFGTGIDSQRKLKAVPLRALHRRHDAQSRHHIVGSAARRARSAPVAEPSTTRRARIR